jgi:UDP-N-acetyl-2-amino-2-deoxyglucuronate dehydrogenase
MTINHSLWIIAAASYTELITFQAGVVGVMKVRRTVESLVHAIIGCGRVAPNHLDGFSNVPGVTVKWACDSDISAARALSAGRALATTAREEDVLSDPDVDTVSIAVDHAQHARLVRGALNAGKHVLVEKPLALTVPEGENLIHVASEAGLVLSVVSQHRYDAVVNAVRAWIAEGLLGKLVTATVQLQCGRTSEYYGDSYWRGTWWGEGGSALINQGYHALDVIRWICDDLTAVGAAARMTALRDVMETEDTLAAVLRSADGTLVSYTVTIGGIVAWRTRIGVVGTAGAVQFDLDHPGRLHEVDGGPELLRRAAAERNRAACEEPPGVDYYGVSHRQQIADFCAAVRSRSAMVADARAGLDTLRLILDIYRLAGLPVDGSDARAGYQADGVMA